MLKLASVEVTKSEQGVAAKRAAITEAESLLRDAEASDVYASLFAALAPIIAELPSNGLTHPSAWDRTLTVRVAQDHVQLVIYRPSGQ